MARAEFRGSSWNSFPIWCVPAFFILNSLRPQYTHGLLERRRKRRLQVRLPCLPKRPLYTSQIIANSHPHPKNRLRHHAPPPAHLPRRSLTIQQMDNPNKRTLPPPSSLPLPPYHPDSLPLPPQTPSTPTTLINAPNLPKRL